MMRNKRVELFSVLICTILICSCMCCVAAYAGEPGSETAGKCQIVKPGDVPQGLDKADWNRISAQIKDAEMSFQQDEKGSIIYGSEIILRASDGAADDFFGNSVSVWGDVALVGAAGDDDFGSSSGSAYVFERNAGGTNAWGQVKKLTASDGAAGDDFGVSVSVNGDVAMVGAPWDDSNKGSAYIFERNAGGTNAWGEVKKLTASDGEEGDFWGGS